MIRVVLVLICVALVVLALLGMRWGWRNRMHSQATLPPLPELPGTLGAPLAPALTGVYVGTTFAASWQDRVVHAGLGLRAGATATLHPEGVLIDRDGAPALFIPAGEVTGVRLAPGLAGTVVGEGGLLVVRWRLGDADLDTGLRADDRGVYPQWLTLIDRTIETGTPAVGERRFGGDGD